MGRVVAAGLVASFLLGTLLAAAHPIAADTVGRPDDPTPDYTYEGVEGPSYSETKGGGGAGASLADDDSASLVDDASASLAATAVTFPYVKYNWTIYSWATTANGLRFYGVYYNSEQVFY